MNITRPPKSGSALLCHTRCVTQPRANATISPVATRAKLGVPSDSQKTPRQKEAIIAYSCTTQTRQLELAAGVIEELVTLQARTVTVLEALTNADHERPASTA